MAIRRARSNKSKSRGHIGSRESAGGGRNNRNEKRKIKLNWLLWVKVWLSDTGLMNPCRSANGRSREATKNSREK